MSNSGPDIVDQLERLLGENAVRVEADDLLPDVIVKPQSTEQVSVLMKFCSDNNQPVVPIGGRTGLTGALIQTGSEIGLSLERMNQVEEVDIRNRAMIVESGCILQLAAEAAEEQNLFLPLDLGARGSATVGGIVATNAGGNRVIRYGMMRDMVLGMEVVLADGTVVSSLNKMIKNNTGYDIKQWFIGAEGTLGVITRVVLRLRPLPSTQNTALLAVPGFDELNRLLNRLDAGFAGTLSAFEVMWPEYYEYLTREDYVHRPPLAHGYPVYVLVETMGSHRAADSERFEVVLSEAMESDLVLDAVLAGNQTERNAMWEIRDDVFQTLKLGPAVTFDVGVTADRMEAFTAELRRSINEVEEPLCFVFGHLGDSNLHVIAGSRKPEAFDKKDIERRVYDAVRNHAGSVSAEHGIGLEKRDFLKYSRSSEEVALMLRMKRALDPQNILNPNKIFSAEQVA